MIDQLNIKGVRDECSGTNFELIKMLGENVQQCANKKRWLRLEVLSPDVSKLASWLR